MAELENGRLVRLVSKLGFINERPEYVPSICALDSLTNASRALER